jgi:hypothetical protein
MALANFCILKESRYMRFIHIGAERDSDIMADGGVKGRDY